MWPLERQISAVPLPVNFIFNLNCHLNPVSL